MHAKVQVFVNPPWRQMCASLILLFGKAKALFGKNAAREKGTVLHTLFLKNETETNELKWGVCFFFMKAKATCKN